MQGSQCIGSARASAPVGVGSTPGRLAKMHQGFDFGIFIMRSG